MVTKGLVVAALTALIFGGDACSAPSTVPPGTAYEQQLYDAIAKGDFVRASALITVPSINKEGGYPYSTFMPEKPWVGYKMWLSLVVDSDKSGPSMFDALVAGGAKVGNPPLVQFYTVCAATPAHRAAYLLATKPDKGMQWLRYLAGRENKEVLGSGLDACLMPCGKPGEYWHLGNVMQELLNKHSYDRLGPSRYSEAVRLVLSLMKPDLSKGPNGRTGDDCGLKPVAALEAVTEDVRAMLFKAKLHLYNHPLSGGGFSIVHSAVAIANTYNPARQADVPEFYLSNLEAFRDDLNPKDAKSGFSQVYVDALLARNRFGATAEGLLDLEFSLGSQVEARKGLRGGNEPVRSAIRAFVADSYRKLRAAGHVVPASDLKCEQRRGNITVCTVASY